MVRVFAAGGGGGGGDVMRILSILCVLGGLLAVGLTSSAAMPPMCMHGTDVLTLFLSLPSPWKPLQMQMQMVTASR